MSKCNSSEGMNHNAPSSQSRASPNNVFDRRPRMSISMISVKRALQFTSVTGIAYGLRFVPQLPFYESPMKMFYGLAPTPVSEMLAQGIGACLITSSLATLWIAASQPVPVQSRFAIIHLICAFARATVMSCHGAKAARAGGVTVSEWLPGTSIAIATTLILAESLRDQEKLATLRNWIKDSKSVAQKIVSAHLIMEFYYVIMMHFGNVQEAFFAVKLKPTDYLVVNWLANMLFMRFLVTMVMFTVLPRSDKTASKLAALNVLTDMFVMKTHMNVLKPDEFPKHFGVAVARLGALLFASR